MAEALQKKLDQFKERSKRDAEDIVKKIFPQKVLDLHALSESDRFSLESLSVLEDKLNIPIPDPVVFNHKDVGEAVSKKRKIDCVVNDLDIGGTKVYVLPNGIVPGNPRLVELVDLVKPEIRELIDYANKIKMWITYSIPRIEDGNNFGVSIQEDSMAEARQVEAEAATYLDQISRYFITRGKLISKVAKYPHVGDYRLCIKELDEKEFVSLRLVVTELRNHYASLHDLIMKNLDKIKRPRTSNTDNMY